MLALTQVNSFGQDKNRVNGTVFHDVNANGILDENEPGIAGVPVSNQLDVGPTVRMNHQFMADPLVVEFFKAYKDIDEWVKPKECSHIWTSKMPADLQEGSHILEITTTDMFGEKFRAFQIFEIK